MRPFIECTRCLLNTEVPGVAVDDKGICSVCTEHDKIWGDWEKRKNVETLRLEKILEGAKRKKRLYDVLVPLSGGKDSTYVLYLCRNRYNLKCLAVTWDNGFLTDHARMNIKNACTELGVDHVYYGLSKPLLMKLYRYFFLKTGFFCPVCMAGIGVATLRTQLAFDIPLSIRGTSTRTEEYVHPAFFLERLSSLESALDGTSLKQEAEILLTPVGLLSSPLSIKLPDYVDWNYKAIFGTITRELGWTAHSPDAEHGDCAVDNVVHYIRYRKYPEVIPEMLRLSKLVTCGQLDRKEALKMVSEKKTSLREPSNLDFFLNAMNITKDDMDSVLSDPERHIQYIKEGSPALRRLRTLKRRFL